MRSSTLALAALLTACAPALQEGHYACTASADCPQGWVCRADSRCWSTPSGGRDAAPPDAAPIDAGPDAEPIDGGCESPPRDVDVLLMVDKSGSMQAKQNLLRAALPELARALGGDVDEDGTLDFARINRLQIGVITSDLGSNDVLVPMCMGRGDDAELIDRPSDDNGCEDSYAPIQSYSPGDPRNAFTQAVGCLARVGTVGCGFEQQLEATLKALSPQTSVVDFFDGAVGNGDAENRGLLRDDSLLVIVVLSDEDDCSTHSTELFAQNSPRFPAPLNYRCYAYPEELLSAGRYSDNLAALREDPADLLFASLIGVPIDAGEEDFDTLLERQDMQHTLDPDSSGDEPIPACDTPGVGHAAPGRRFVEVARGLRGHGADSFVDSICAEDYTPFMRRVATRVFERLDARSCPAL